MSVGLSFDAVLAAAQAGAGWARARLYEDLAPAVAGYFRSQGAREPADLTSEVFVAVLTGLPGFRGDEAGFRSWVFRIAYRKLVDSWRDGARPAPQARTIPSPSAEEAADARLGRQRVEALLDTLTPDQRQVLALRVVADLSLDQTAAVLGKPVGAVKALQHRALEALRRRLGNQAVSR